MRRTTAPGSDNGFYVDEDRNEGRQGTAITAFDRNAIQDELIHVIESVGLIPSGADNTQLESAIGRMIADQVEISTSQAVDLGAYRSSLLVSVANGTPLTLTLNRPIGRPGRYLFVVNDGTDTVTIDGTAGIMATLSPGSILFAVGDGTAMSIYSLTSPYARGLMAAANAAEARGVLDVYSGAEVESALDSRDSSISAVLLSLATNQWDTGAKLVAPVGEIGDNFGRSVSLCGDYAIIGVWGDAAGGTASGAAYIFRRTGPSTWDSGFRLTASDAGLNDQFGWSVATDGDYAIVGAAMEEAAYVFRRTGLNEWVEGAKLVVPDAQSVGRFGWAVAIEGDYVIVTAPLGTNGLAHVFRRTGVDTWNDGVRLVAPDGEPGDRFGISVSLDEGYAIIGAPNESELGTKAGAAYIFRRTGVDTWSAGVKLTAPDGQAGDNFGWSVATDGDYAIVGGINAGAAAENAGVVYVFRRTSLDAWDSVVRLVASDAQAGRQFGRSVAIDGDHVIVGDALNHIVGAAYVFSESFRTKLENL